MSFVLDGRAEAADSGYIERWEEFDFLLRDESVVSIRLLLRELTDEDSRRLRKPFLKTKVRRGQVQQDIPDGKLAAANRAFFDFLIRDWDPAPATFYDRATGKPVLAHRQAKYFRIDAVDPSQAGEQEQRPVPCTAEFKYWWVDVMDRLAHQGEELPSTQIRERCRAIGTSAGEEKTPEEVEAELGNSGSGPGSAASTPGSTATGSPSTTTPATTPASEAPAAS